MPAGRPNPANNNLLNKQIVILAKDDADIAVSALEAGYSPAELFERRAEYLRKWQLLDGVLGKRVGGYSVYNFGASMWTWLLAGYCPAYWAKVKACMVDGEHGQAVDKIVLPPLEIRLGKEDCVVLGINPINQASLCQTTARSRLPHHLLV